MTAELHSAHHTPAEIRASLKADRSPRNIRAWLPLADRDLFDRQYWHELDKAKHDFDLTPVNECLLYWWWQAYEKADPAEYADTIARADRAMDRFERGE